MSANKEITQKDWLELLSIVTETREMVVKLYREKEKELLTPAEVCEILGISRNTFQRYVSDGVFELIRLNKSGRNRVFVRRSEIDRLINEGKI